MSPTLATLPKTGDRTIQVPLWFALEVAIRRYTEQEGWTFPNTQHVFVAWGSEEERKKYSETLRGTVFDVRG